MNRLLGFALITAALASALAGCGGAGTAISPAPSDVSGHAPARVAGSIVVRIPSTTSSAHPLRVTYLTQPAAVAVVKGGTTLVAVGQSFVASFDEETQTVLVDNSTVAGSAVSKITLDLAGTAWFASLGPAYYGVLGSRTAWRTRPCP
jgi:hypothetical protein